MVKQLNFGDYYQAMIDGLLCEDCGILIDWDLLGIRRKCSHCGNASEMKRINKKTVLRRAKNYKKISFNILESKYRR